jgi:hypothetical membrane protein
MAEIRNITLPPEVIEKLDIYPEQPVQVTISGRRLQISQEEEEDEKQVLSLRWFIIPTILATLLFFTRFTLTSQSLIPLTGNNSLADMVEAFGTLSGFIVFFVVFIRQKRRNHSETASKIYWRNFPTIAFAFASMLLMVNIGFFELIDTLFMGAKFDIYTATILFFIFLGIINYIMISAALMITPTVIITLISTVILGGMTLAMLSNSKLGWWHQNFSFLGTSNAKNNWEFNLTLILSALLMIALIDYLFVAISQTNHRSIRFTILRVLLTLTSVAFGAVGLIPNNGHGTAHMLHDFSAQILVLFILALIIGLRWLIPNIGREFLNTSYFIGLLLGVGVILFQFLHYFSLTAFEIICAALSIVWLMLLLQHLLQFTKPSDTTYMINVTPESK